MSHSHEIVAREPLWVLTTLTLDRESVQSEEKTARLTEAGEQELDGVVDGHPQDDLCYACRCGAAFPTRDQARDHLLEMYNKGTELVTAVPDDDSDATKVVLADVEPGSLSDGTRRTVEKRIREAINSGTADEGPVTDIEWDDTDESSEPSESASAEEGAPSVRVTWHPQVWEDGRAVTGETTEQFIVPFEDASDDDGNLLPDDSGESDSLRFHENAPDVVREWSGPFYMTLSPTDVPPPAGPWPRWAKQV